MHSPGGFTEYVCWRSASRGREVRGLGFTLRASCDWELAKFGADAPTRGFSTHYGADGSGDIYVEANMDAFARDVDAATQRLGVALMMADGYVIVGAAHVTAFRAPCLLTYAF